MHFYFVNMKISSCFHLKAHVILESMAIHTSKSGHGEGNIVKIGRLADGRLKWKWRIWATLPDGSDKRLTGTFIGTKAECRMQMQGAKAKAERSGVSNDPNLTVAQLLQDWLQVKSEHVSARTINIYRQPISHITKEAIGIGGVRVRALTTALIQDYYTRLNTQTTLERTREQVHGVLNQALDHAVRMGVLEANPTKSVERPRARSTRRSVMAKAGLTPSWEPSEAAKLHQKAMQDAIPMSWAIAFGLHTGLRRGEILGLRWKVVDLANKQIRIAQTLTLDNGERRESDPKNEQSRRDVPLNDEAVKILKTVQSWQADAAQDQAWQASGYVFTTRDGKPQHPNNMKRKLNLLCQAGGIRYLSPHSLRHTFVSLQSRNGVPLERVSRLIGHKNPTVTLQVYRHLFTDEVRASSLDLDLSAD